jgi:hypothetical protein
MLNRSSEILLQSSLWASEEKFNEISDEELEALQNIGNDEEK